MKMMAQLLEKVRKVGYKLTKELWNMAGFAKVQTKSHFANMNRGTVKWIEKTS